MMPPWPGQDVRHVLDAEVALDERLEEVADGRGDGHADAQRHADEPGVVEEEVHGQRAADHAQQHRAGEALPRLLGADRRGHRVLAEEHAGDVAADVAADCRDDEDDHPLDAVLLRQQQHPEADEERRVGQDEDAAEHVASGSLEAACGAVDARRRRRSAPRPRSGRQGRARRPPTSSPTSRRSPARTAPPRRRDAGQRAAPRCAIMTARAMTTANDSLRMSSVEMMSAPRPTPTAIAVGRSRPARLGFFSSTCSGGRPAMSSRAGS